MEFPEGMLLGVWSPANGTQEPLRLPLLLGTGTPVREEEESGGRRGGEATVRTVGGVKATMAPMCPCTGLS